MVTRSVYGPRESGEEEQSWPSQANNIQRDGVQCPWTLSIYSSRAACTEEELKEEVKDRRRFNEQIKMEVRNGAAMWFGRRAIRMAVGFWIWG